VDCKKLFEWTFEHIKLRAVVQPSQIVAEMPVKLSWSVDHVQLVPEKEVLALIPSGNTKDSVLVEIIKNSLPAGVNAPVKKGQVLGEAAVLYADTEIARFKLVAAEDVDRNPLLYAGSLIKWVAATKPFKVAAGIVIFLIAAYIGFTIYVNLRKQKRKRLKVLNYRDVQGK
jgi:D-alanyl-D-alanine carboxypeptidase